MKKPETRAEIDEYLISRAPLENYSVSDSGGIAYTGVEGREFDLHWGDEELYKACLARLLELGVRTAP